MFVITLAPLTGIPQPSDQLLHYFSKEEIAPGQLVEIILNKRKLLGVVFFCAQAQRMRIAIKNSPYPLKNIVAIKTGAPIVSTIHRDLALWISSYYYASLGIVLQAMLRGLGIKPDSKKIPALQAAPSSAGDGTHKAILVVGLCPDALYKKILSSKQRILVLVPERKDIVAYEKKFRALVPSAIIMPFHSDLKTSEQQAVARKAYAGEPCIIIGTRSALLLPFYNLSTIIVENPQDTSHTSWDQNPHLNSTRVAMWLHKQGLVSLFFHAEQPTIELMHYARTNKWNIRATPAAPSCQGSVVDMRESLKQGNKSSLSKEVQRMLTESQEKKKPVFLFVQRRGFSSGIICRDCGFVVMCPSCNVPMVYHDQGSASTEATDGRSKKFLLCHRCGKQQTPPTTCPSCHGSRIRFIGAGSQRVEEEVKKMLPSASVCRLDSDAKLSSEFLAKCNPAYDVFVGTSFAWSILNTQSLEEGAIITIDGLLSLPDYRSQERVYEIIQKMKRIIRQEYIIQTYCPDSPIFSYAIAGNWDAFEKKERSLRKILKWPPFVQIIRMQYGNAQASAAQTQAQNALRLLQAQIKYLHPSQGLPGSPCDGCELLGPSPAYIDRVKNKFVWEIILKWPLDSRGDPQNLALRNRLLAVLPRGWNIDVDPVDLV